MKQKHSVLHPEPDERDANFAISSSTFLSLLDPLWIQIHRSPFFQKSYQAMSYHSLVLLKEETLPDRQDNSRSTKKHSQSPIS